MKFKMTVVAPKYWYVPCTYHLFISYILCKKSADFQFLQVYFSFNCIHLMVVLLCLIYCLMLVDCLY